MTKPRGRIDRLARECGIKIIPYHKSRAGRKHKVTHARRTLQRILRAHGAGHVRLTLRCIVESSKENAHELNSEVIGAVSDVLKENPDISAMNGLLEAFESISLTNIRRSQSGAFRTARRHRIAGVIIDRLRELQES